MTKCFQGNTAGGLQLNATDEAAKQTNHAQKVTARVVLHHKLLAHIGHTVKRRPCYHQNITQCPVGACTSQTTAVTVISTTAITVISIRAYIHFPLLNWHYHLFILFYLTLHSALVGNSRHFTRERLWQPQEQCYPFLTVRAVFSCVQTRVWLSMLGIFNVRTGLHACGCTWGLYRHRKRVCTES